MSDPPLYEVRLTKRAIKDIETLSPKLKTKLKMILDEIVSKTPMTVNAWSVISPATTL